MLSSARGQRFGKPRPPRPLRRLSMRLLRLVIVLIVLYFVVSGLLVDTFEVGSVAMEPQAMPGDRLFATSLLYGAYFPALEWRMPAFRTPQRGDVVSVLAPFVVEGGLLRRTGSALLDLPLGRRSANPLDDEQRWASLSIRRIIGVPGDTVRMDDFTFYVRTAGGEPFVNEFELSPGSYDVKVNELPSGWRASHPFSGEMDEVVLGEDEYFVAGDNRVVALDSRDYGPIGRQ